MSNKFKILSNTAKISKADDLFFAIFKGGLLLRKENDELKIPSFDEITKLNIKHENEFFLDN